MDTKKVGILTFHAAHNCGSLLQSYALQYVLSNKYNCNTEFINFSNNNQQDYYSLFPTPQKAKHIARNMIYLMNYKSLKTQFDDYNDFILTKLKVSTPVISNADALKRFDGKYDLVFCGSDQIWNTSCYDGDDAYFLPFIKKGKKAAYAVSMGGTNILEKDPVSLEKYKGFIESFDRISVRERNSKRWLDTLLGGDQVSIQLDPTLLLSKNEWSEIVGNRLIDDEYIFLYSMNFNDEILKKVKEIAEHNRMSVYVIDKKSWIKRRLGRFGFKVMRNNGPLTYLNMIANASLVITNSLHGTIFSSIFERKFWSIRSYTHNDNDDRASFLLEQLKLGSRFIEIDKLSIRNAMEPVDYNGYHVELPKLKNISYGYIKECLEL